MQPKTILHSLRPGQTKRLNTHTLKQAPSLHVAAQPSMEEEKILPSLSLLYGISQLVLCSLKMQKATRAGRGRSYDHAAALIACWMGHGEVARTCVCEAEIPDSVPAYHCQYYIILQR